MTTAIEFRFPFGRYHATPWGRHTNEGAVEWPPSPWRLARAMLATWFERAPELAEDDVLAVLELCSQAPTYQVPRSSVGTTRHYVPEFRGKGEARTLALDSWIAVDPEQPLVVSWDADLSTSQRKALETLLTRLPYLGRAESLVDARLVGVAESVDTRTTSAERWTAGEDPEDGRATTRLLGPTSPVTIEALTARTGQLHSKRLTSPPGTRVQTFVRDRAPARVEVQPDRPPRTFPTAFRYAIVSPKRPPMSLAIALADLARAATQSRYGKVANGGNHPALSGRGDDGPLQADHQHAHWLVVGERRVESLVVWIPGADDTGGPAAIDDGVVETLLALRTLRRRKTRDDGTAHDPFHLPLELGLEYVGDITGALGLAAPTARTFETVTPFLTGRHRKRGQLVEDLVAQAIRSHLTSRPEYADQDPTIEILDRPWAGVRRYRLNERIDQARVGRHVRLTFADAVAAPLSIGDLSHFGAGLFLPTV